MNEDSGKRLFSFHFDYNARNWSASSGTRAARCGGVGGGGWFGHRCPDRGTGTGCRSDGLRVQNILYREDVVKGRNQDISERYEAVKINCVRYHVNECYLVAIVFLIVLCQASSLFAISFL